MIDYFRIRVTYADGGSIGRNYDSLLAAQRAAARYSRSAERGGPSCIAVVYEGDRVYSTWRDGEQVRAK